MNEDWRDYCVIATGGGEKLERWGDVVLLRPDPQAIWKPSFALADYKGLHARYARSNKGGGAWEILKPFPDEWKIGYRDLTFLIKPMGFKHTGLFPEQAYNWDKMRALTEGAKHEISVLNLFAYTGGATAALAKSGAKVTHVDAAKNMVERAKTNCALSGVAGDRVRYIVDDCAKFVAREYKRGKRYDAVVMDPPSYGRGPGGEMWKLEDSIYGLVEQTARILTDKPLFFLINSYTTGLQPTVMADILGLCLPRGRIEGYEVTLPTQDARVRLPCGCSAIWTEDA